MNLERFAHCVLTSRFDVRKSGSLHCEINYIHLRANKNILLTYFQSSRDLVCLQQLDYVDIYRGRGWKKKYKAPSDYCFALKVNCRSRLRFIHASDEINSQNTLLIPLL